MKNRQKSALSRGLLLLGLLGGTDARGAPKGPHAAVTARPEAEGPPAPLTVRVVEGTVPGELRARARRQSERKHADPPHSERATSATATHVKSTGRDATFEFVRSGYSRTRTVSYYSTIGLNLETVISVRWL